ncbi:AAA family ATPase [Desulfoluna butyratoxydans]|uniref:Atpase dynein-related aaa domain n=1 Tax=Desulfoluna butyratoxydans TaxID=231438 RepID=A0A4U8YQC5_9BACT|nr:MoxR family ATPase [Desulfoluna butyratoxydans]VFQ45944.1 atpase dynein-related aaa domain [Desulfoluna butyratoxydans]
MKPSHIATAVSTLIQIRQPTFLWGPPGIGKSQVVRQTADAMGLELIDIRAILLDPVDLRGIPRIGDDGTSTWCAPSFLPRSGTGVLFLDELNAAPPLVQAACYQLVLDRRLGEYTLPEGWAIIAAGNREQDRAVTHRMPSALANRFVHIDFSVDHEEWLTWAEAHDIAPEVTSFIRFRPKLLHDFDPERADKAFPSPRSWEFVSRLMGGGMEKSMLSELVAGTVGKGAAAEFCGYVTIRHQLPDPESILSAPNLVDVPTDPAVLFALCEMLALSADSGTMDALLTFASRLPDEFSVLLIREAARANNRIVETDGFARWAEDHAEVLM